MKNYKIEEKEHFNRIVANDGYWIKVGDEYVKHGYFPKTFEVVMVSNIEKAEELNALRELVLSRLNKYSESVKTFTYNGESAWLDQVTRFGLSMSTTALMERGYDKTSLWLNGKAYPMECNKLMNLLMDLEAYAFECNNVTERHRQAIKNIADYAELNRYDYTVNYPNKLNFEE